MKIQELPFYSDLELIVRLIQYSAHYYNAYNKGLDFGWGHHEQCLKDAIKKAEKVYPQIIDYMNNNQKEIESNPLIKKIFDLCIFISKADINRKGTKPYMNYYIKYVDFQKEYKLENHIKEYIDAGCILNSCRGNEEFEDYFSLIFPPFFPETYAQHGGERYAEPYWAGLFPNIYFLKLEEVIELYNKNPDYFSEDDKNVLEQMLISETNKLNSMVNKLNNEKKQAEQEK